MGLINKKKINVVFILERLGTKKVEAVKIGLHVSITSEQFNFSENVYNVQIVQV